MHLYTFTLIQSLSAMQMQIGFFLLESLRQKNKYFSSYPHARKPETFISALTLRLLSKRLQSTRDLVTPFAKTKKKTYHSTQY